MFDSKRHFRIALESIDETIGMAASALRTAAEDGLDDLENDCAFHFNFGCVLGALQGRYLMSVALGDEAPVPGETSVQQTFKELQRLVDLSDDEMAALMAMTPLRDSKWHT